MASHSTTSASRALTPDAIVWDMVFPLIPSMGNGIDKLVRFSEAGFHMVSLTIANDFETSSSALQRVSAARREILERSDRFVLVRVADDILRAKAEKKLAIGFHFSGTGMFERNLDLVDSFYELGIRNAQLTFNSANEVGAGCGELQDGGLTRFGKKVVREMERVGMLIDLSHVGYRTSMDALLLAERPMIFTHSNAHAICSHYRNIRDDQIKACAESGGLVGVSCSSGYLGVEQPSTEAMFRHIDYISQLVGVQHVGLGLDIVFDEPALNDWVKAQDDWPESKIEGWSGFHYLHPHSLSELIETMVAHGYGDSAIRAVCGQNWFRVCRTVWQ